jgi:hypothetical protein
VVCSCWRASWRLGALAYAQSTHGELRIEVRDSQGAAVSARAELVGRDNRLRRYFPFAADGRYVATRLPFGIYRVSIDAKGFVPWAKLVRIPLGRTDAYFSA